MTRRIASSEITPRDVYLRRREFIGGAIASLALAGTPLADAAPLSFGKSAFSTQIVVFDRSWYGRVLVERIEGFAAKSEWKRAYREINEFERTLIDDGARIAKVFLHITPEEQAKRFKDRLANPLKRWKLSYEDFRNRDSWKGYTEAIEDMMEKTSTGHAPWYLVPANNKNYSRLAVFNILIDRLGHGVDLSPKPLDPRLAEAAEELLSNKG